jgi:protein-tyrosine sulfotransferase
MAPSSDDVPADSLLLAPDIDGRTVKPGPPVFVVCNGRSGSTLLRFLLDAHPDLACPPETNLPQMAAQLATVWSLIEGAPLAAERGDEPPVIPDAAIAGVRRALDEMTGSYLARRGRKRYCDKSLGTARFAPLLLRIFPQAKFLCLYRHPMDVIASGLEACPWGLSGYGFDAYIASTPGNSIWALARFWVDSVAGTLSVEEQFAAACHRIRYEDLVADPEAVAADIFEFLGVAAQPGISRKCFSPERERFGPADYKIWHTSQISSQSVGRGWALPAGMIPPPAIAMIRELTDKLGYMPVDGAWGATAAPADLRVGPIPGTSANDNAYGSGKESSPPTRPGTRGETSPAACPALEDALRSGLASIDDKFADRWSENLADVFAVRVATAPGSGRAEQEYRVDLSARTVTSRTGQLGDDDDAAWDMVGTADAWQAVLTGNVNLGVILRRCELRYCEGKEAGPAEADRRVAMLADLLALREYWVSRSSTNSHAVAAAP